MRECRVCNKVKSFRYLVSQLLIDWAGCMGVMPTARSIENSRNDKPCQLCLKLSNDSGMLHKPCGEKTRILVIK